MTALLALFSSLLWGTSDFMAGTATRRLPAAAVTGWSQIAGLAGAFVIAVASGSLGAPTGYLGWGVVAGLAGPIGLVCFYNALSSGTMGVVAPLASIGVLVPFVVGLLLGDNPNGLQFVGVAVIVLGVVLASGPELRGSAGPRPLFLAGFAALCFGGVFVFLAEGSISSPSMTLVTMRVTSVSVLAIVGVALRNFGGVGAGDLWPLALIGLFDMAANLTYGIASTRGLLSLVAVLSSLYPVVTALLAHFVHHERLARIQYVGVGATVLGVIALSAAGGAA
jgi:drug/metabolite transporter (DMT)-like permease